MQERRFRLELVLLVFALLFIIGAVIVAITKCSPSEEPSEVPSVQATQPPATSAPVIPTPEPSPTPYNGTPAPIFAGQFDSIYFDGRSAPETIADSGLTLLDVVNYNGNYMEDGSNELMYGVFGVLLRNDSGSDIAYATLDLTTTDGLMLKFNMSNLPAGKRIIVLDANKTDYCPNQDLYLMSHQVEKTTFNYPNQSIAVVHSDGITVTNLSDIPFGEVFVCYKHLYDSETFLGGISYRSRAGSLAPKKSVKLLPTNFIENASITVDLIVYQ